MNSYLIKNNACEKLDKRIDTKNFPIILSKIITLPSGHQYLILDQKLNNSQIKSQEKSLPKIETPTIIIFGKKPIIQDLSKEQSRKRKAEKELKHPNKKAKLNNLKIDTNFLNKKITSYNIQDKNQTIVQSNLEPILLDYDEPKNL